MSEKIKVSIVVPVYNVENYVARCINSLMNQTLRNIEIILVDDGSTDSSGKMCDEFAKRDERIRVIHKENGGLGYARNSGMEIAKGEFIGFVDSDDYVDTRMFEALFGYACKYDADYVRCEHIIVDDEGNERLREQYHLEPGIYAKEEIEDKLLCPMFGKEMKEGREAHVGISVWRAIFRTSIIKENHLLFPSEREVISEDIPFNLDFLMHAHSAYVTSEGLYYYVERGNSLTKIFRKDRFDKEVYLYCYLQDKLKEYNLYEKCKIRIKRFMLDRGRRSMRGVMNNSEYSLMEKYLTLKEMMSNEQFRTAFDELPVNKLPLKYRIMAYMMKYKMAFLIMICSSQL